MQALAAAVGRTRHHREIARNRGVPSKIGLNIEPASPRQGQLDGPPVRVDRTVSRERRKTNGDNAPMRGELQRPAQTLHSHPTPLPVHTHAPRNTPSSPS